VKARRKRPYRQRVVKTVMPADSVFRFQARVCAEGRADKHGLRVTIPMPVVRGLEHLGWAGFRLRARINDGASFIAYARHPNTVQSVFALPKEHRGAVGAGELAQLEVTMVR
jgi:hypothetical protein